MNLLPVSLSVKLPDWLVQLVEPSRRLPDDSERMRFVISLARENVIRQTGGPFGAAVFDEDGTLVSVGVNLVVPAQNSVLHAEIVALLLAHHRLRNYDLDRFGCELYSSCDPCAMCLGATFWSGVRRLLCGAPREAATEVGFDEGPVFPESYAYLRDRGVTVIRRLLEPEACEVFRLYRQMGGEVYNGHPTGLPTPASEQTQKDA